MLKGLFMSRYQSCSVIGLILPIVSLAIHAASPARAACVDNDTDGYGQFSSPDCPIPNIVDCNDTNASIHPGATEIVGNNVDEDCNGSEKCYQDNDHDSYGSATVVNSADADCADVGEATFSGDCADNNAAVYPGAVEIVADGTDQDCNGGDRCYQDVDNDNYGSGAIINSSDLDCLDVGEASVSGDCNDTNASINPAAAEIVGDGIDQNCNGGESCYQDLDNDDYGTPTVINSADFDCADANEATVTGDCNDSNATIHPGASEIVADGIDQNCDGGDYCYSDADNDDYGAPMPTWSADLDCNDVNESYVSTDCDDGNPSINPATIENCTDGLDTDCDSFIDCGDADCASHPSCVGGDVDGDGINDGADVCDNTPPGVVTDAEGRPLGDIDEDCDTDLADFYLFQLGFTGPLAP